MALVALVALEIRSFTVEIFDPEAAEAGFRRGLPTRFALRFGGRRENEESARNLAARHGDEARKVGRPNPWAVLYDLASKEDFGLGSFAPHWVYPGEHRTEQYVARTR